MMRLLGALFLWLWLASASLAQVVFDASSVSVSHNNAANNITLTAGAASNITIGSGSNRLVVFWVMAGHATTAGTVSSVTWDNGASNQAATFINGVTFTDTVNMRLEAWCLVNPVSGNKGLLVNFSTAPTDNGVYAVSYTGVNQTGGTTSCAHFASTTGASGSSPSVTVTSATNNAVTAAFYVDQQNITSTNNTQLVIDNTGNITSEAVSRAAGAATVTNTSSPVNGNISAGVDVVAANAAACPPPSLALLGVGC